MEEENKLPKGWVEIPISDSIIKISIDNKLQQKDYLEEGLLPVVDQGQKFIGGYINDKNLKVDCILPIIIFGDHTKVIKLINFPFVAGADGVKILKPLDFFSPKLFTYFLNVIVKKIPDKGYARHFQYLEKSYIKIPPYNEQLRIVEKIEELFSELDNGIQNLKTAKEQLKIYRQSVLKWAFEGKLTEKWRERNSSPNPFSYEEKGDKKAAISSSPLLKREGPGVSFEPAENLLERIKLERQKRYEQQIKDWKKAVKEWEENGKQGKKSSAPSKPKEIDGLTKKEISDLPELPNAWLYVRFGELLENIEAGKSFTCEERPPKSNEYGVAKVSAVTWGEYDEQESKTCLNENMINEKYLIKDGDFIFSRANTIELVGACVIAKNPKLKKMLSDKTLRFKFLLDFKKYSLYYLRSKNGKKEIESLSTGNQESMRNIGQDRIKSIKTPICSLEEQNQIVQEIESRLSVVEKLEQTIEENLQKADTLRQSILKKAFEGKLVPQDPNDEPASLLLDKIKNEPVQLSSSAKKKVNKEKSGIAL